MKSLVVYYSRTGNSRIVGREIASLLGSRTEEIVLKRDGPLGFLICGMESSLGRNAPIEPAHSDLPSFDLIIIGGPIWATNLSSPVRAYLSKNGKTAKRIAFFCTMGGTGSEKAFSEMSRVSGKMPEATLAITEKEIADGSYKKKLEGFARSVSSRS